MPDPLLHRLTARVWKTESGFSAECLDWGIIVHASADRAARDALRAAVLAFASVTAPTSIAARRQQQGFIYPLVLRDPNSSPHVGELWIEDCRTRAADQNIVRIDQIDDGHATVFRLATKRTTRVSLVRFNGRKWGYSRVPQSKQ